MTYHIERVNSVLRQTLSELLLREVKDPRLGGFISITAVETSADMKFAKVYVSSFGDEDRQEILAALATAAGFLRRELSANVKMRRIPQLSFRWDESIERGDRLLRLIDEVDPGPEPEPDPEAEQDGA
jgi:ribosome-binding factor A